MPTLSMPERLEEIDRLTARAGSIITVLVEFFCIESRPSELADKDLVQVLESVEELLARVREHSGPAEAEPAVAPGTRD